MNKRKITIHFALASAILASVLLPGMVFGGGAARSDELLNAQSPSQVKATQKAERRTILENLTNKLVAHSTQFQQAGQTERLHLEVNLLDVAAMRHLALAQIIEDDPAEILRVAVSKNIRACLPFAAQRFVEQHIKLEGELEVYYEDWESGSRLLYFLEAAGERYSLHFANDQPTHLMTGAQVRIKGVRVGQAIALDSSGDDLISTSGTGFQTLASVQPNTFGEQKVLVILVNFQDKQTQPFSINHVRDMVFGTVNDFYKESSYQQTWLTGDVYGWYTMPIISTSCSTSTIATYAKQAATSFTVR